MNEITKKYLYDINECILFIEEAVNEIVTFQKYRESKYEKPAIERKLEIIGEALHKALLITPEIPISNKHKIVSVRNRIIHAYDSIDDALIWEIVQKHLPTLKKEITSLLEI